MSFFLAWILPLLIFFAIGQYMSRKIMDRAGGNSMMFGGSGNQEMCIRDSLYVEPIPAPCTCGRSMRRFRLVLP